MHEYPYADSRASDGEAEPSSDKGWSIYRTETYTLL